MSLDRETRGEKNRPGAEWYDPVQLFQKDRTSLAPLLFCPPPDIKIVQATGAESEGSSLFLRWDFSKRLGEESIVPGVDGFNDIVERLIVEQVA